MDKKKYTLYFWKEGHLRKIDRKERTLDQARAECFEEIITGHYDLAEIWLNEKLLKRFRPVYSGDENEADRKAEDNNPPDRR